MPPLTPKTLTRLDPAVPLLWRDGETLQIGLEGTLRIPASDPWVERLLTHLATGFRRASFDVIAHAAGAPRAEARALLARLEPLLLDDPPVPRAAWVESLDVRDGRCAPRLRDALLDEGVAGGLRTDPGDIGVVLVEGAATAIEFARYLREDTAHLPVALERGRITIGPLVVPGESPCLGCRDRAATDDDPAWPRLHAQLIGRPSGPISAARIADAATVVAQLLAADPAGGSAVVLNRDGSRVRHPVPFHAGCLCHASWSRSPRGNATEPVPLVRPNGTRTGTGYARPA